MGSRYVSLVCVAGAFVLSGCGGSSHTPSTTTVANTSASGIVTHLLNTGELSGFKGSPPSVYHTASAWLGEQTGTSQVTAAETKPLTDLGFVAAARENLNGPDGHAGLSLVEQFKTPGGARSELAAQHRVLESTAPGYTAFSVPGIPGAFAYAATGPGINLAFASGDYYYLVGEFVSAANARSEAGLIAAANSLRRRAQG
jgi:hypothetical protein